MQIKIITCSKTKDINYLAIEKELLKRLSKFCKVEIIEINSSKYAKLPKTQLIEAESKLIKENLKNEFLIALDEHEKELDTINFSKKIEEIKNTSGKFCIIIGGAYGLSQQLIDSANLKISLSKLTFTSQITRLLILEQIYRSFTILSNIPYHKGDK